MRACVRVFACFWCNCSHERKFAGSINKIDQWNASCKWTLCFEERSKMTLPRAWPTYLQCVTNIFILMVSQNNGFYHAIISMFMRFTFNVVLYFDHNISDWYSLFVYYKHFQIINIRGFQFKQYSPLVTYFSSFFCFLGGMQKTTASGFHFLNSFSQHHIFFIIYWNFFPPDLANGSSLEFE